MKTAFWIVVLALAAGSGLAAAAAPKPLDVTVEDLAAAGVPDSAAVADERDRFKFPVAYFRVKERLAEQEAKKDCADCVDLVAVYAAEISAVPVWASEPQAQFMKLGGRLQVRTYLPERKRIVTVTAPSEAMARSISRVLVEKFSK